MKMGPPIFGPSLHVWADLGGVGVPGDPQIFFFKILLIEGFHLALVLNS